MYRHFLFQKAVKNEQKAMDEAAKANKEAKDAEEGRDRKEAEEIEKEAVVKAKGILIDGENLCRDVCTAVYIQEF